MSFLTDFMEYIAEKVTRGGIQGFTIEPYSFSINRVELPYSSSSTLRVDPDGDIDLNFEIDKGILMEELLDEEDMINYLGDNGYKVVEEED